MFSSPWESGAILPAVVYEFFFGAIFEQAILVTPSSPTMALPPKSSNHNELLPPFNSDLSKLAWDVLQTSTLPGSSDGT